MPTKLDSSIVEQQIQSMVFATPRCKNWAKSLDLSDVRYLAELENPARVESISRALAGYHNETWRGLGTKSILDFFFCCDIPLLIDGHYISVDITLKKRSQDLRYKLLKAQAFAPLLGKLLFEEVKPVIWGVTEAPTAERVKLAIQQSKSSDIVLL